MELLSIFIIFPIGALLVGGIFAAVAIVRRKVLPYIAAGLWIMYGIYEGLMYARVICTGECNIRVDLLLIYPILLIVTILGIISALRSNR